MSVYYVICCKSSSFHCFDNYSDEFDALLPAECPDAANKTIELKPCKEVYFVVGRFLSSFRENDSSHAERLERLCRFLLASLESENPKLSYIGVALNKELSISWIRHIKMLLYKCCLCMEKLKPGKKGSIISMDDELVLTPLSFLLGRIAYRQHRLGFVSTHARVIHIAKYLGHFEIEVFGCIEARYESIVQ